MATRKKKPAPVIVELRADRCETCRHWLSGYAGPIGTCKRYPPAVLLGAQALPHTVGADWCGEHAA